MKAKWLWKNKMLASLILPVAKADHRNAFLLTDLGTQHADEESGKVSY